jgi:hypothetical protein
VKDANHRFSVDRTLLEGLAARGWTVEGAVMCVE